MHNKGIAPADKYFVQTLYTSLSFSFVWPLFYLYKRRDIGTFASSLSVLFINTFVADVCCPQYHVYVITYCPTTASASLHFKTMCSFQRKYFCYKLVKIVLKLYISDKIVSSSFLACARSRYDNQSSVRFKVCFLIFFKILFRSF